MNTTQQTKNRTLTLKCHHGEVERLHQFLRDVICEIFGQQVNKRLTSKILLAVHEVFTNIVRHAYTDGGKEETSVFCKPEEGGIAIEIVDHGKKFNPLESTTMLDTRIIEHVQNVEDLSELDENDIVGGYGIPIIRASATSTKYWRSESGDNHLYMYFEESK